MRLQTAETLKGKVQPSLLPRENSLDPAKIFTLTPNGERERERERDRQTDTEMKKGCEVKHLSWQMLHNRRANAVFE